MKPELRDYIAAHTKPLVRITGRDWSTSFAVVGEPLRDQLVSRLLATPRMDLLLDGRWHDVLQVVDLIGQEMALRLMILGDHLKLFEVSTPMPNVLAFKSIGVFKPLFGKEAFDPINAVAHLH